MGEVYLCAEDDTILKQKHIKNKQHQQQEQQQQRQHLPHHVSAAASVPALGFQDKRNSGGGGKKREERRKQICPTNKYISWRVWMCSYVSPCFFLLSSKSLLRALPSARPPKPKPFYQALSESASANQTLIPQKVLLH